MMAVNKPVGDNARKGAVRKRTQLKNPLTKTPTKRTKEGGQFMAVNKSRSLLGTSEHYDPHAIS
jgi:arginine deiminase